MRYPELHYRWQWRLHSTPEQLWPLVSNTDRFNRDTGLPAVSFADRDLHPNARKGLELSRMGVELRWEEEPFEWVRPYRFGVKRRYETGPLQSLRVRAELNPDPTGGTRLVYESWVVPGGLLGLIGTPPAMSFVNRRSFGAAFRKYDEIVQRGEAVVLDQATVKYAPGGKERLDALRRELGQRIQDNDLAAHVVDAVAHGDNMRLAACARMRWPTQSASLGAPRSRLACRQPASAPSICSGMYSARCAVAQRERRPLSLI
jgi:hypothetical protein